MSAAAVVPPGLAPSMPQRSASESPLFFRSPFSGRSRRYEYSYQPCRGAPQPQRYKARCTQCAHRASTTLSRNAAVHRHTSLRPPCYAMLSEKTQNWMRVFETHVDLRPNKPNVAVSTSSCVRLTRSNNLSLSSASALPTHSVIHRDHSSCASSVAPTHQSISCHSS